MDLTILICKKILLQYDKEAIFNNKAIVDIFIKLE